MCDDNYGAVDAKPGMRISVYVDHIDFVPFDQVHEPVAALRKINYSVRHPLEAIVALDEDNIFEFADGVALSLTRPRPHRRQHEPGLGHRSAQAHRIRPDPTDRIRRHQHRRRPIPDLGPSDHYPECASRAASRRGRASWISLNVSYRSR